ncbi:grainyhead-like [Linnemannia zychae]|nr:grainyhead-like [Linnemannia zychae]
MQHQGETPSTYLNKGQFYTLSIHDTEEYDGDIHSVIKIAFHEDAHRKLATRYWNFWLSQQPSPKTARALDIERASSTGMLEVQSKAFDKTQFKWNGKEGVKLMIRFNCLSTDFSRIKGVKGIPLRIQLETFAANNGPDTNKSSKSSGDGTGVDVVSPARGRILERSFAKIKLFRDKGAERKNKDDQKHLEKMWDKMRGKNADMNPLSQVLAPVQQTSTFWECPEDEEDDGNEDDDNNSTGNFVDEEVSGRRSSSSREDRSLDGDSRDNDDNVDEDNSNQHRENNYEYNDPVQNENSRLKRQKMNDGAVAGFEDSDSTGKSGGGGSGAIVPSSSLPSSSRHFSSNALSGPSDADFLDKDPSYVPQQRKKKPMALLCLYIKIGNETVYRAIYLERPTLHDLTQKLCEKLEIQSSTVSAVYRRTIRKCLLVRMDDAMVAQMTDELDMEIEYEFNHLDGSVNLTLKY